MWCDIIRYEMYLHTDHSSSFDRVLSFPGTPEHNQPAEGDEREMQVAREGEHPPQCHRQYAHRLADGPPPEMQL